MADLSDLLRLAQTLRDVREQEEQVQAHEEAWRAHLLKLLEVLDSFERALASEGDGSLPRRTVELIAKQLRLTLESIEVERINAVGQTFTPAEYRAFDVVYTDSIEEDTIVEEIVVGYRWRGALLRQPEVRVARPLTERQLTPDAQSLSNDATEQKEQ